MKSQREIEIKLKVSNARKVKRLLRELGFRRSARRQLEHNFLFDFRDCRLAHAGCALRLRTAGGRNFLTYKGTASTKGGYKSREEIETGAESARALRRIIERLGLREACSYSKYRTIYKLGEVDKRGKLGKVGEKSGNLLVYDETPVGNYIELEGSRRWIDQVAKRLGYRREDYVTTGYVALYRQGRGRRRQKGR
ncbi:MAG: class IV adenylate cyclase [Terriglobia bacterium]